MARPKRAWSKVIEEGGITVRVYEREPGALLSREVRIDGRKDRKSLRHRDRALAESQARALAQRLAELQFAGQRGPLTLGQLEMLYRKERVPLLSSARQRSVRGMLTLLFAHFRRDEAADDLSQHQVDAYVAARTGGKIKSPRHRTKEPGVRAGTVRNELHLLCSMLTWAQGHRVNGRRLLTIDPLAGVVIPREKNMRRPIATDARYRALQAVAAQVEPRGQFRCILALARHTGRRINAICSLSNADVLRTRDQVLGALGAAGMDLRFAEHWPNGAIRWTAASDKLGFESIAPLSKEARAEIDLYLKANPRIGAVPFFESATHAGKPTGKAYADYWLRRAVKLANVPRLERGGYHTFRRLWASERRHLPAQDVAAAGGWRSLEVMRTAYQQADAATVYSVVENAPSGHTPDTPREQPQSSEQVS